MKLSVVIPFWNAERWLTTSITSALGQDFPAEIIAVDDGSTDGGAAVAASFGPRVKLIRQANAGVSVARNRGLAEATGDYVIFLDADDYFEGQVLRGVAAAAAGGHDVIFSPSGSQSPDAFIRHKRGHWQTIGSRGIAVDIANGRTVAVHAQAFRRDALLRLGYRVGEIGSQDTELLLRALLMGASVGFNEEGLAIWSLRPSHDGLSTRRDLAVLASGHAWHRDHLATLITDPVLRKAYAWRCYGVAVRAFADGYRELGREALSLARSAGLTGHRGSPAHRVIGTLIGLERKTALARALRRARAAVGLGKPNPGDGLR